MNYTKKRYITYLFLAVLIFCMPFVTINGNHLLLLSFESFEFHFFGSVFDVNEFYVMPFLLILFFVGIFALTSVFGRLWCGFACPQTIFRVFYRDFICGKILKLNKTRNKQKSAELFSNKFKYFIAYTLWLACSFVIASNFSWYFIEPELFFNYLQNPTEHLFLISFITLFALFIFADIVWLQEKFCSSVCPYSRVQMVLYDENTKYVIYNTNRDNECLSCNACVKICPAHIDIRKGLQLECINCLECSDACEKVMTKSANSSLINWGSTNEVLENKPNRFLSKKNILYIVAMVASILFTIFFTMEKSQILVLTNRTPELYQKSENGAIKNNYIVTIRNVQNKTFSFDIKNENSDFAITHFKSPTLSPDGLSRSVLVLETNKTSSGYKDLKLIAYAKENPQIKQEFEVRFFYPKN